MRTETIHGGMMCLEYNFANQSSKNNLSIIVYVFLITGLEVNWYSGWTMEWSMEFFKMFSHRNIAYCLAIYSLTIN